MDNLQSASIEFSFVFGMGTFLVPLEKNLHMGKIKVSLKLISRHPNDLSGMSRGGILEAPLEYLPAQDTSKV